MTNIDPSGSIPIHIARAYGVTPTNKPAANRAAQAAPPAIGPINSPLQPSTAPSPVSRIVAARVPGGIDFLETGAQPFPSPSTSSGDAHSTPVPRSVLPMYNHPADRNSAATAINAGRLIDITA